MARKIRRQKGRKYINKNLHFALLIGVAVVSFWRGTWGLMDLYLLPDNQPLSFGVSLIIGVSILLGTHYLIKELTGE